MFYVLDTKAFIAARNAYTHDSGAFGHSPLGRRSVRSPAEICHTPFLSSGCERG